MNDLDTTALHSSSLAGQGAEMLIAIIEALPDPVVVVDRNLRILAANKPADGIAPVMRAGLPLALAVRAPGVLEAASQVANTANPETLIWSEPVPIERAYEVRISHVEVAETALVVLVFRDISEMRRVERMRVDFIANASHELRTPLASLLGFIETLQGSARNDPAAREKFLGIMRDQARRMSRLVDDLLQLSRIEQSLHLRPQGRVDLVSVAGHVIDTLRPVATEAGVQIVTDMPEAVEIPGDRDELIRVVENLVENAIKYGSDSSLTPPRVDVTIGRRDETVVLTIRDYGPGIAQEHLPRLTERFYRVDAPASRAKGGTGLGLAIVKHIVARHRGKLAIASTKGGGAEFRVSLPAV